MSIEQIIFNNLVYNEPYARKVVPFIKDEYFSDYSHKILIGLIKSYIEEYNTFPNKESLAIDLSNKTDINQNAFDDCKNLISSLSVDQDHDLEWLENNTEKFCQDKAIYNSIMKSIEIIDDKTDNEKSSKGSIPQILSDALAVSFDTHIGHDFIEDAEERYDFYHKKEQKIPFDITLLNEVTKGGLPRKTLNIVMAGTGVGKSLFMCHAAAANLMAGNNVLYITLEMAEEKISERIDANLLDEPLDSLKLLPKESYKKKVERLKAKTTGKLIVKEYPTACAGSANFRHLLNELKLKKKFKPDVIYIDYLNICMSSRIKNGSFVNSYTLIKSIAEELRGLAIEFNVPIVSATQTTRSGYCLALDTMVFANNMKKKIIDVEIGDMVDTSNGKNKVVHKFPLKKKMGYKITLESGKEIICSKDHLFPTKEGEKSLKRGLKVGEYLQVKRGYF